jgi:type IV secretory pathway TraG/TraD family ATPase VirD4
MQLVVSCRFPLAGLWCLLSAGRLLSLPGLGFLNNVFTYIHYAYYNSIFVYTSQYRIYGYAIIGCRAWKK